MKFIRMKRHTIWKAGLRGYDLQWLTWKDEKLSSFSLSPDLRRQITRTGIIISVFAIGIVGILQNSLYTLRIALGSVLMLALLRYHYALLLAWVLIITLVGAIPILAGNNFLTGLIAPTLLLMAWMPIKQTFKRMPALGFLLIYFLWVFASIGTSPLSIGAFLTLWIIFLAYVAIGVLTINVVITQRRMVALIDAMFLPSTIIALYGIYGYIARQNGDSDPTTASLFRIHSIFHSAPSLALFLSLVIPLTFYRILTSQGARRIVYSILLLIFLLTTVLTFTRDALISLPLSIIIMIFFLPSRKMRIRMLTGSFLLAALILLVAVVGNLPIFDRFFSQDLATLNGRTITWQLLLDRFDPTQLLGKGLEASDTLLTSFQVSNAHGVIPTASHSIFIEALYDHGIIGVTLLILVFIALFVSLVKGILKAGGERRMLFAAALAVLTVMLFESFASNDFWIEDFSVYFWIIMALPFALCWQAPKQLPKTNGEESIGDEATEPSIKAIQPREPVKVFAVT